MGAIDRQEDGGEGRVEVKEEGGREVEFGIQK